ncbi:MAG: HPr family phosphocarrier protein [Oscillospiraceae bacterium]|jgi:phosphotransferase system HPr-like phosphotransfer protein|nr:HPr family phosphocarrier protein [Oscillospiraceae bacterium]
MTEKKIKITTIDDVKKFVSTVMTYEYDADVVSGRYAVDAKSIMGLFSLDLSGELTLKIHSDDCGDILADLAKFIV